MKFWSVYGHFTKNSLHFLPSWATLTSNNVFSPTHTNFLKNEPDIPRPQLHSELVDDIADCCAQKLWRNYEKNKRKSTISDHKLGFLIISKIVSRPPKQALQSPIKSFGPQDLFVKTLVSARLSLGISIRWFYHFAKL